MKKKIEFKKIALAFIVIYCMAYITVGRSAELCGITVDSSTDVALIYTVLGSYIAYCGASASDHINIAKNGYNEILGKGDGSE